jgi:hypothetical protein
MNSDEFLLEELQALEKSLQESLERLRKPYVQAEDDLKNVMGTIAILKRNPRPSSSENFESTTQNLNLRGLTHKDAVVAIAKANGGVVRAQDAKRMMIKAGVMSATKNSTNMTHNVIIKSDLFDRIGPGEYRLKRPDRTGEEPLNRDFSTLTTAWAGPIGTTVKN